VPIEKCQKDGKPGYRWGEEGTCYTYTAGNENSREQAYQKALQQARAIKAQGGE
jgi:hypothetical protein